MSRVSLAAITRSSSLASLTSRKWHTCSASLITTARTSSTMANNMRRILSICTVPLPWWAKVLMVAIWLTPVSNNATWLPSFSVTVSIEIFSAKK